MSSRVADGSSPIPKRSSIAAPTERDAVGRIQDLVLITGVRPSLFMGAASLWDFAGLMSPRVRVNPQMFNRAPLDALAQDWELVGRDMWKVLSSDNLLST